MGVGLVASACLHESKQLLTYNARGRAGVPAASVLRTPAPCSALAHGLPIAETAKALNEPTLAERTGLAMYVNGRHIAVEALLTVAGLAALRRGKSAA